MTLSLILTLVLVERGLSVGGYCMIYRLVCRDDFGGSWLIMVLRISLKPRVVQWLYDDDSLLGDLYFTLNLDDIECLVNGWMSVLIELVWLLVGYLVGLIPSCNDPERRFSDGMNWRLPPQCLTVWSSPYTWTWTSICKINAVYWFSYQKRPSQRRPFWLKLCLLTT